MVVHSALVFLAQHSHPGNTAVPHNLKILRGALFIEWFSDDDMFFTKKDFFSKERFILYQFSLHLFASTYANVLLMK